jgi:hypothetical protein
MAQDCLVLIKELIEENERLKDLIEELQQYNEAWVEDNGKLRKEIERLKQQHDAAMREQFQAYTNNIKYFEDIYNKELDKLNAEKADVTYFKEQLIADTVRKFLDKFKDWSSDDQEYIDRYAKEILEENNE